MGFQMGRAPFDQAKEEKPRNLFTEHLKVARYRMMKAGLIADAEDSSETWASLMFAVCALEDAEDAMKRNRCGRQLVEAAFKGPSA